MNDLMVLARQGDGGGSVFGLLVWLAIVGVMVASMWRVFAKAGQPGWGCLVPIYNVYLLCRIANRPAWWLVLFFIPVVNFVLFGIVSIDIAKAFGKGAGFGVGMWLLGFVFYPILAFSAAEYLAPGEQASHRRITDHPMAA